MKKEDKNKENSNVDVVLLTYAILLIIVAGYLLLFFTAGMADLLQNNRISSNDFFIQSLEFGIGIIFVIMVIYSIFKKKKNIIVWNTLLYIYLIVDNVIVAIRYNSNKFLVIVIIFGVISTLYLYFSKRLRNSLVK